MINEKVWNLWNCFTRSACIKNPPLECINGINLNTLEIVQFQRNPFCWVVQLTQFIRLSNFSKYYKRKALFSQKNLKNKFNIFFSKIASILIHIYHLPFVHFVTLKLLDSMLSFIIYYLCYLFCYWQNTQWIKGANAPHGSMGNVPNTTHLIAISFQNYWFPSLNFIQVSHDNSDSILICSMNGVLAKRIPVMVAFHCIDSWFRLPRKMRNVWHD